VNKWRIGISAGSNYQSYADSFLSDDILLLHEHDEHTGHVFFAYSPHLEEVITHADAWRRAASLLLLVNGAKNIAARGIRFLPFDVTEVWLEEGEASRGDHGLEIEEFPFGKGDVAGRVVRNKLKRSFDSRLLHVAKQDSIVRSALFFGGLITGSSAKERILAWGTLYKLMEAGKALAKTITSPYEKYVDDAALEQFTAACNNMSILGLDARHGPSSKTPPKRVLTDFDEAVGLILGFLSAVSQDYLASAHPGSANG
jgi:hypothetical protein